MSATVLVASKSAHKLHATQLAFDRFALFPNIKSVPVDVSSVIAPQPVNSGGEDGARARVEAVLKTAENASSARWILAVENAVEIRSDVSVDVAIAVLRAPSGKTYVGRSFPIKVPSKFLEAAQAATPESYPLSKTGLAVTVGEKIRELSGYTDIEADNWMSHHAFGGVQRALQIEDAIVGALAVEQAEPLGQQAARAVHIVQDFPSPGVKFVDVVPLFVNAAALHAMISSLAKVVTCKIDYVLGSEARGWALGAPLAYALGAGFICCRKPGKLPVPVMKAAYQTEYSTAELHIEKTQGDGRPTIPTGACVVCVDDLVATGGTSAAMIELAKAFGAEVPYFLTLYDVPPLRPVLKKKLAPHPDTRLVVLFDSEAL